MKRLIPVVLLLVLCLSGCGDQQAKNAETVLTFCLNANGQLQEAYETVYGEEAADPTGEAIRAVLEEQVGAYVTEDFIDAYLPGSEISSLAIQAYLMDFTYKTESITVEKADTDGQYFYEASLVCTDSTGKSTPVAVSGVIQYDDGKIRTITLRGQELEAFYQTLPK